MTACLASTLCVDYDRRTETPALAEDGPLCEGDLLAGERAVTALVLDYRDLEQRIPPSLGVWGDGQPGCRDEHRVPMNLAVEALQRRIWWVLTAWEEVARERDRLSESVTRQVRAGWAVQAASQILRPRVRLLAAIGPVEMADYPGLDGEDQQRWMGVDHAALPGWYGVLDFAQLHRRSQVLLGLTRSEPELCDGVPCRDCDMKTLYRVPGSSDVECLSCRLRLDEGAYRRWLGIVAAAVRRELEEFERVPGDR